MPSSTLMNGLFGLSVAGCAVLGWMTYERRPSHQEAVLRARIGELEEQLRQNSKAAVKQLAAPANSSADAEALATLRLGLLDGGGDDMAAILDRLDQAIQQGRDAAGIDHEGEIVARYFAKLQIERLRAIGAKASGEVERRIEYRDEHQRPLAADFRAKLLQVLLEIDPRAGVEAAARIFAADSEDPSLRLVAAHGLKQADPPRALRLAREVFDRQRGRSAMAFQNFHELVGILGELGQVLGTAEVAPLLRDLATRQDWDMSARHRAISWIETLGLMEAYPDLERVVREPGHNHYTRVIALQTMRALDPERLLPTLQWIIDETSLDPVLKQNAELMKQAIEAELAARTTASADGGR